MLKSNKEANIVLALQALRNDPNLALCCAAIIYKVPYSSLWRRYYGVPARCDIIPKVCKLSELEENIVV